MDFDVCSEKASGLHSSYEIIRMKKIKNDLRLFLEVIH